MTFSTNLNDQELFRYALPGHAFLIVLLSYAAIFEWDQVSKIKGLTAFLLALSGLPLGYILQNVYRGWFANFGEQLEMERNDADGIRSIQLNHPHRYEVFYRRYFFNLGSDNRKIERAMSLMIDLFLTSKDKKILNERIYFLISRVHSMGATIFSIMLALLCLLLYIVFTQTGFNEPWSRISHDLFGNMKAYAIFVANYSWPSVLAHTLWFALWILVIIMLIFHRNNIRQSYEISSNIFINSNGDDYLKFFGC